MSGVDACMTSNVKCDGRLHCPDYTDELASQCPGCVDDPTRFTCRAHGKMVCLSKDYQCDGQFTCDDGSDDHPTIRLSVTTAPGIVWFPNPLAIGLFQVRCLHLARPCHVQGRQQVF